MAYKDPEVARIKGREYGRQYYWKHKEQQLENARIWRRKRFFYDRARDKRKFDATAWQLMRLWVRQRGRCALTGVKLTAENAHLDHVIPRAKGGISTIENLRWLHAYVNLAIKAEHNDQVYRDFILEAADNIQRMIS